MPRLAAGLLASQFGLQMLAAGAQLKALAQHGEGSARGLPAGGIARERQQLSRRLRASQQHAQAVAVPESQRGIALRDFGPEAPHAKVALPDRDVVKQHHGAAAQLGTPAFKVMAHGFVGVQAVDMQQIDAAVGHVIQSLVKGFLQQGGKVAVGAVVLLAQGVQHALAVVARVGVALPGVHAPGAQRHAVLHGGLAESKVGHARIHAQLHQRARARGGHQPGGKGNVPGPGRGRGKDGRLHPRAGGMGQRQRGRSPGFSFSFSFGWVRQGHALARGEGVSGEGARGAPCSGCARRLMACMGSPSSPALALVHSQRKASAS